MKILDTRKRKGGGNSRASRSSDVDSGKEADMEDDESPEQGEDRTIPKPQGENQRRNRGGYNVSEEVEFEPSLWEEIEVRYIEFMTSPSSSLTDLLDNRRNVSRTSPQANWTPDSVIAVKTVWQSRQ